MIKFPQLIEYAKCFDSNKNMSFRASDKKLFKKDNKIKKKKWLAV